MDKVRPGTGREGGLGRVGDRAPHGRACSVSQEEHPAPGESLNAERNVLTERRATGYAQDVRYFAIEHMDVRREVSQICTAYQMGIL